MCRRADMFVLLQMAAGFSLNHGNARKCGCPNIKPLVFVCKNYTARPHLKVWNRVMKNTCWMFCMQFFHNIFLKWSWTRIGFVSRKWLYIYIYIDEQNSFQTVSWGTVEWNLWTCETWLNNPCDLLLNFFEKKGNLLQYFQAGVFHALRFQPQVGSNLVTVFFPKIVGSLYCTFSAPLRRTWVGFVGVHS